jgi:Xaa-Pro aminopeptidase
MVRGKIPALLVVRNVDLFCFSGTSQLRMSAFNTEAFSWHIPSGLSGSVSSYIDAPSAGKGLSAAFPVGASMRQITAHKPVLASFGTCFFGYQVDQPGMFCIGRVPKKFRHAQHATQQIESEISPMIEPGVRCKDL